MFLGKTGNSIISQALNSFQTVATQLDEGIKLSEVERTKNEDEVKRLREVFVEKETVIKSSIQANIDDIAQATKVKDNIHKLLTGTFE